MRYLPKEHYIDEARGLQPGETVRVNHEGCPAGVDTKRRLYVTLGGGVTDVPRDMVLAYCHNCSTGGRSSLGTRRSTASRSVPKNLASEVVELPKGTTFLAHEFSPDALRWLRSYDLVPDKGEVWVGYDRGTESLVFPCWSERGVEAYQTRSFRSGWDGPKYLTRRRYDADIPQPVSEGEVLVLTEDTLSAVKVSKVPGLAGCPLWTAPKGLGKLLTLSKFYKDIVVWYDNDNTQVRHNALQLARRLRCYHPRVYIVLDKVDPKCYTVNVIKDTIEKELRDE